MTDYSQKSKLLKVDDAFLMFAMQLDSNQNVIPGLNQGRLTLWSFKHGYLGRWVATSSFDGKQSVGDWEKRGGVHCPNYAMDDAEWFEWDLKYLIQPGQPVDEGYLLKYKGSNNMVTLKGNPRSEKMGHPDKNYLKSPGSAGCIVMLPKEWEDFKNVLTACCGHLKSIPYGIIYTF
jgi:hypothetical protein